MAPTRPARLAQDDIADADGVGTRAVLRVAGAWWHGLLHAFGRGFAAPTAGWDLARRERAMRPGQWLMCALVFTFVPLGAEALCVFPPKYANGGSKPGEFMGAFIEGLTWARSARERLGESSGSP